MQSVGRLLLHTSLLEVYTPATNIWSIKPSMPAARNSLITAVAVDSKLYTIGASNNEHNAHTVEVYDPSQSIWKNAPGGVMKGTMQNNAVSMRTSRYGFVTGAVNGVFYVAGGRDSIADTDLSTLDASDPLLPGPAILEADRIAFERRRLRAEAEQVDSARRRLRETSSRLRKIFDDALAQTTSDPKGRLRPGIVRRPPTQNEDWLLNSTTATDPLRQILQPFAGLRESDRSVVKFTGDAGAKLEPSDQQPDTTMEQLIETLLSSERRSLMLRLENIVEGDALRTTMNTTKDEEGDGEKGDAEKPAALRLLGPMFGELLRPYLPIGGTAGKPTAHVYVSNGGASALKNHTDVTEIVVLQILGHKEWLYCTADDDDRDDATLSDTTMPTWLKLANAPEKTLPGGELSSCSTYDKSEMTDASLTCERVVTSPGDTLFLPRETIHSARSVGNEVSVHLTIGIPTSEEHRTPSRRRLGTCTAAAEGSNCNDGCDDGCDSSCDDDCDGSCNGSCDSDCDDDCDGSCSSSCNGGYWYYYCWVCTSSSTSCDDSCNGSCSSDCNDDCDDSCDQCDACDGASEDLTPSVAVLCAIVA